MLVWDYFSHNLKPTVLLKYIHETRLRVFMLLQNPIHIVIELITIHIRIAKVADESLNFSLVFFILALLVRTRFRHMM